jgi:hypothetical protein
MRWLRRCDDMDEEMVEGMLEGNGDERVAEMFDGCRDG